MLNNMDDVDELDDDIDMRLSSIGVSVSPVITKEQIKALLSRYHWAQVYCTDVDPAEKTAFLEGPNSGWDIIDYGNALATSAGFYQWLSEPFSKTAAGATEDDSGESGGESDLVPTSTIRPTGTLYAQAWNAGQDLAALAAKANWSSIQVYSASRILIRSLTHHSQVAVTGVDLDLDDQRVLTLVSDSMGQLTSARQRPQKD